MTHDVKEDTVAPIAIAVLRRHASLNELPVIVPAACGEVWNFLRTSKITGLGRNVAVYLDDRITLECGVECAAAFTSDGNVRRSATPAGAVACATYFGPYQRLHEAYGAIRDWCRANHRALAGPNWEIYGHWTDDVSKLRTDVFYLLIG